MRLPLIAGSSAVALLALPITLGLSALQGCDFAESIGLKAPTGDLLRVDLLESPSTKNLLSYACYEWVGSSITCQAAGFSSQPAKSSLRFSFDLVFDLHNPNTKVPIPLVELLLGFTALKDTNLGAVCVQFCDPEDTACEITRDAEGACDVGDATDVTGPEDLDVTVDDLLDLADAVTDGELANSSWRYIEPGGNTEAHIQFDLGIDPVLELMESLLVDAATDYISGNNVSLDIPYTVNGTMFFDLTEARLYSVGFGPFADTWVVD